MVGATLEGDAGLRVWYCSLPPKQQTKPVRYTIQSYTDYVMSKSSSDILDRCCSSCTQTVDCVLRGRALCSSQVIVTASMEEARRCQRCLQQACCWDGHPQPRKLLVIINPKSGQGRCMLLHTHYKCMPKFVGKLC